MQAGQPINGKKGTGAAALGASRLFYFVVTVLTQQSLAGKLHLPSGCTSFYMSVRPTLSIRIIWRASVAMKGVDLAQLASRITILNTSDRPHHQVDHLASTINRRMIGKDG